MFEGICDVLHREMEMLEEKYADSKAAMNGQDLEHIDTMAHALKCLATYEAMKEGECTGYDYGRDRGRAGRYTSRDAYEGRDGGYRRY